MWNEKKGINKSYSRKEKNTTITSGNKLLQNEIFLTININILSTLKKFYHLYLQSNFYLKFRVTNNKLKYSCMHIPFIIISHVLP